MLWELSVAEQRYRAVLEAGAGVPVTEVAERYGVSRQSVHTWLVRYRQEGIAGLEDRSHQVHNHPWRIPAEVEELICELRRGHPKWGPRRLVFEMGRRGHQVTRSSVYRTLVQSRDGLHAVEVDRVVPPSGNLWIGGQQVWLGPGCAAPAAAGPSRPSQVAPSPCSGGCPAGAG